MTRTTLIAGNWKMHGRRADLAFFNEIRVPEAKSLKVLICPPATLLAASAEAARGTGVLVGGQDCHAETSGAHTGDVSAAMLRDAGASHVIVGHSERRQDHGERDCDVRAKAEAAQAAGLVPIICVGETRDQREAGEAEAVVARQLAGSLPKQANAQHLVIAYEPVWAIGTGLTASVDDVAAMHASIRKHLPDPSNTSVLYGGSVKPGNAAELLALVDVDGALVGGASLKPADFNAIIRAFGGQS
ncbi:triose-phosphate isomerase [Maricaulis sp. CAU 1757]